MNLFKIELLDGEVVTVYVKGIVKSIDLPLREPVDTFIPNFLVFDVYSNDITDSISDEDYARIEKEIKRND